MNNANTILDPFKDLHTEADLIHVYPHKIKKVKRRWDMVNLLNFSSKYLKTLEIIKHRKRVSDLTKIPVGEMSEPRIILSNEKDEKLILLDFQSINHSNDKKNQQKKENCFHISSPNHNLFKRPDSDKLCEKGPRYWTIVEDVNKKCIQWVSQNFPKQQD